MIMENQELQLRHEYLVRKVKEMLEAQQAYFKSGKDFQLLKKSKAIEKEVRDIVFPKQVSQSEIDWLGK